MSKFTSGFLVVLAVVVMVVVTVVVVPWMAAFTYEAKFHEKSPISSQLLIP